MLWSNCSTQTLNNSDWKNVDTRQDAISKCIKFNRNIILYYIQLRTRNIFEKKNSTWWSTNKLAFLLFRQALAKYNFTIMVYLHNDMQYRRYFGQLCGTIGNYYNIISSAGRIFTLIIAATTRILRIIIQTLYYILLCIIDYHVSWILHMLVAGRQITERVT